LIDDRFPLTALWESQWGAHIAQEFQLLVLPVPLPFVLVLQIVTGIFLTMNKPDRRSVESVEHIRDVSWGWLIRYMHHRRLMFFIASFRCCAGWCGSTGARASDVTSCADRTCA
jgi:ubiquinol-cytochrome c reductase cytochrome b subunit